MTPDDHRADERLRGFTFNHGLDGTIECEDEDGDLWRIVIRSNRLRTVVPMIVWTAEDQADG